MNKLSDHITETVASFTDNKLHELYDEALNEEGDVKVCGCTFRPSEVLKECDPIAYRTGFVDWLDGQGYVEYNGETYDREEFEEATAELVDRLTREIDDLEGELREIAESRGDDPETETVDETLDAAIRSLQADIDAINKETDNL